MPELIESSETVLPLWVDYGTSPIAHVSSPKGVVGMMQCVFENQNAWLAECCSKNALTMWPTYRLNIIPPVLMISRKEPFERGGDYMRESTHPGVYCEFYSNRRGRFMRLNDAHRHVTYELARAAFVEIPPGFPDPNPDLDLGWMI